MKALCRLTLLLSPLICSLNAKDMHEYLNKTVELTRAGQYEEALGRHVWFHYNALEHQPSMTGVRLSFALSYWTDLGKKYPPALQKLKEIRDEKEALIQNGKGSFELFHDVSSINRELGEDKRTLELFKQVVSNAPQQADRYWIVTKETAFKRKDYDLINEFVKDIDQEFRNLYSDYLRDYQMFKEESHRNWARTRFAAESKQLADLATYNGDESLAAKITERSEKALKSKDGIIE
ncbi:MAG: hypothetical protein ACPGES_04320 [Coraliomargarita sp.]